METLQNCLIMANLVSDQYARTLETLKAEKDKINRQLDYLYRNPLANEWRIGQLETRLQGIVSPAIRKISNGFGWKVYIR